MLGSYAMLKPRRFDGAALYHKTRCEKGWPGRSETEELERRAIGSLCERQRGGRNLLAGLQGKEHRAVLVGIVGGECAGAIVECVDHRRVEIEARLHDRSHCPEGRRGRLQLRERVIDVTERGIDVAIGLKVAAAGGYAEPGGGEVGAIDGHRGRAGFVECYWQGRAGKQVDPIEAGVLGGEVDLRYQRVE